MVNPTRTLFGKSSEHEIPHHQGHSNAHPHRRAGNRKGLFGDRCLYIGLDGGMLFRSRSVLHRDIDGIGALHAGLLLGGGLSFSPTPVQDDATRRDASAVEITRPRSGYLAGHLLHPLGKGYAFRPDGCRRLPVSLRGGAIGGLALGGYAPGSAAREQAQQSERDKGQDDGLPKEDEAVTVLGFHGGYF